MQFGSGESTCNAGLDRIACRCLIAPHKTWFVEYLNERQRSTYHPFPRLQERLAILAALKPASFQPRIGDLSRLNLTTPAKDLSEMPVRHAPNVS